MLRDGKGKVVGGGGLSCGCEVELYACRSMLVSRKGRGACAKPERASGVFGASSVEILSPAVRDRMRFVSDLKAAKPRGTDFTALSSVRNDNFALLACQIGSARMQLLASTDELYTYGTDASWRCLSAACTTARRFKILMRPLFVMCFVVMGSLM